jgi:symplekin
MLAHSQLQIAEACALVFAPSLRDVFTPDALAVALGQLSEQTPVPLLFMRSVIQTAGAIPKLQPFIIDVLVKLVLKQVWKTDAKTWEGVLRCAKQLVPRSFAVYLQLPAAQLREALVQAPDLVGPLAAYANTDAVRPRIAQATLDALEEKKAVVAAVE